MVRSNLSEFGLLEGQKHADITRRGVKGSTESDQEQWPKSMKSGERQSGKGHQHGSAPQ
jgi:hypothetical protein